MGRRQDPPAGEWCWSTPDPPERAPSLPGRPKQSSISASRLVGVAVVTLIVVCVAGGVFLFLRMWSQGVVQSGTAAVDAARAAEGFSGQMSGGMPGAVPPPVVVEVPPEFDPKGARAMSALSQARVAEHAWYAEQGSFTTDTDALGLGSSVTVTLCGRDAAVLRSGGIASYVSAENLTPYYGPGTATCPQGDPASAGWSTMAP